MREFMELAVIDTLPQWLTRAKTTLANIRRTRPLCLNHRNSSNNFSFQNQRNNRPASNQNNFQQFRPNAFFQPQFQFQSQNQFHSPNNFHNNRFGSPNNVNRPQNTNASSHTPPRCLLCEQKGETAYHFYAKL